MRLKKSLELTQMELLFSHRAPITLPVERQRDLTAALADLLLNAAIIKCEEPISDIHREVEDASEANVEAAGLQHHMEGAAKSGVRGRLRIRQDGIADQGCRWPREKNRRTLQTD